jgi:hypothetical protein
MVQRQMALTGNQIESRDYVPLLKWLIFTGVVGFCFWLSWMFGLFQLMIESDKSYISLAVVVIYVLTSIHCLFQVVVMSREIGRAHRTRAQIMRGANGFRVEGDQVYTDTGEVLLPGRLTAHIRNLVLKAKLQADRQIDQTLLLRGLADSLKAPINLGTYAADSVLKLGLLGTIVGFILMLVPIAGLDTFDAASMKNSMRLMGDGMAVAMYTTLAGLVGSILIKAQYYILDDSAAYFFGLTTNLTEVFVVSTLGRAEHGRV